MDTTDLLIGFLIGLLLGCPVSFAVAWHLLREQFERWAGL